ncbi:TetR/AcrR family transcriptional regulator, partial [Enterobacter hormaechei]|uniref:TetR/AcrR family transcriptional regulator n=1 Tax=Enterobacter hormaechei TaxID=158836 RepID=UPI00197F3D56
MSKIKNPSKTQQKTLNEILKVASEQFSQSGFEAVSIELIAREANISRATVYNFYNSKDEILEELFSILLQKLRVLENMADKTPDTVL